MLSKIRAILSKSNAAMVTVYVLFVLFPHFAAISHSHPGGDRPHTHSFLDLQNENLRKAVLVNLGDVRGLKSISVPVSPWEEVLPPLIALERGVRGLQPTSLWHNHFQEDPNVLAWAVVLGIPFFALLLRRRSAMTQKLLPELAAFRPVARGPPVFSFLP